VRVASLADVKAKLSAYLQEAETTGPVVITRNGKAVAMLLAPADDDDLERLLLSRSARFRALLAKSRNSIREGRGLAQKVFWATVNEKHSSTPRQTPGAPPTRRKRGSRRKRARS